MAYTPTSPERPESTAGAPHSIASPISPAPSLATSSAISKDHHPAGELTLSASSTPITLTTSSGSAKPPLSTPSTSGVTTIAPRQGFWLRELLPFGQAKRFTEFVLANAVSPKRRLGVAVNIKAL